ncbi:hypothetical protein [Pantoea sp. MQR6]|uniref:hypothetical protein n=1 Tax=Pantoea sp. MQR6 TaxID=2907307 RepID=UPI001FAA4422|nr:hypothetical protein [Pantoea sp. MQR6]
MKKVYFIVLTALSLSACKPSEKDMIALGQDTVRETLKDPDSAKFESFFRESSDGEGYVCGTINAKNSYGGYTGRSNFYVYIKVVDKKIKEHGPVIIAGEKDKVANERFRLFCS